MESDQQLKTAIDEWLKNCNEAKSNQRIQCNLGAVSESEVNQASKVGFGITGFKKRITSHDRIHILNEHGDASKEEKHGQVGMNDQQIKRGLLCGQSVKSVKVNQDKTNSEIRYNTLSIDPEDGGEFEAVNQVSQKNKRISIITMWKRKRPIRKK